VLKGNVNLPEEVRDKFIFDAYLYSKWLFKPLRPWAKDRCRKIAQNRVVPHGK
jgi:hypothetical protein